MAATSHGVALDPPGRHADRRGRWHREHEPGALLPDRPALGPLPRRRRAQGPARDRRPDDRQAARRPGGRGGRRVRDHARASRTPGRCAATSATWRHETQASSTRRSCRSRCPSRRASPSSSRRTSRFVPARRSRSSPRCRPSTAARRSRPATHRASTPARRRWCSCRPRKPSAGAASPSPTLIGWAMASGHPDRIASIPAESARLVLEQVGLTIDDMDLIEINEAFAAVPLVSTLVMAGGDATKAEEIRAKTNVNGGAIAIGHPTGRDRRAPGHDPDLRAAATPRGGRRQPPLLRRRDHLRRHRRGRGDRRPGRAGAGARVAMTLRADYAPDGGEHPGEFPYTRGISADPEPWIMGQYAGFGTRRRDERALPGAARRRCHRLLRRARPAHPDGTRLRRSPRGGRGRQGRRRHRQPGRHRDPDRRDPARADQPGAHDRELDRLHLGGAVRRARGAARRRPERLRPVHPERRAQGVHRPRDPDLPAEPSLRLSVDVIEYVARHVPRWVPLADLRISHPRSPARTPRRRSHSRSPTPSPTSTPPSTAGVSIDAVAPTLFTFLSSGIEFLERGGEVPGRASGLGAASSASAMRPHDPRSEQLRIFVFTAGSSLTAQQPLNNVVRTTVEALAAALAGVQTMHVCAYDEALGVPTEAAATLALRTQQIVAFETGLTRTRRPARRLVRDRGADRRDRAADRGAAGRDRRLAAAPWPASSRAGSRASSAAAAYRQARAIESGAGSLSSASTASPRPSEPIEVFRSRPGRRAAAASRASRSLRAAPVARRCRTVPRPVEAAARSGENVVPACVEAVKAYATVGEIVARLRTVFGEWRPSGAF